jgi:hypothetical protein
MRELNDHLSESTPKSKFTRISVFTLLALLVIGMLAHIGAYTTYGTEYSQYTSTQTNECGNGYFATQIMCYNDQTSIQGSNNIITDLGYQSSSSSSDYMLESNSMLLDDDGSGGADGSENGEQQTPLTQPANEVAATGDPTLRVFPCCDDMPIE